MGVQPLLLKGLLSAYTEPATVRLLSRIVVSRADTLVDPTDGRLLFAILGSLPYLTAHAGETDPAHLSFKLASNLATAADVGNFGTMAKWFRSACAAAGPVASSSSSRRGRSVALTGATTRATLDLRRGRGRGRQTTTRSARPTKKP